MKKLLALCLLLAPIAAQAKPISYTKFDVISEADNHKKQAKYYLGCAENMCIYIPDLADRDHMKTLIASIVSSAAIKDPREKVLSIGLALIGSMANNMFDKYCKLKEHLLQVAYHLEMSNFYNGLSFYTPGNKNADSGTKAFFSAIDNLTMCEMLTEGIEDEDAREIISNYIIKQRRSLIDQFTKNNKLSYSIYEDALCFFENIYEIMGEVDDDEIRDNISMHVYSAVESIAQALRELEGYNCWPDLDSWCIIEFKMMLANR